MLLQELAAKDRGPGFNFRHQPILFLEFYSFSLFTYPVMNEMYIYTPQHMIHVINTSGL